MNLAPNLRYPYTTSMPYKVDIVVPVYHEGELFKEFYQTAAEHVRSDWRMLVVYDIPDDSTLPVAQEIAARDPRVVPVFNPERGVAGAVKTGIRTAVADAVFVTAVDLLEDLKKTDEMTALFYEKNYTIVAPSRYMKGGERHDGKLLNRTLSRTAGLTLYFLTRLPIHDATNGSKMYRKSFLDSITLESTRGWEIALEITVKAHAAGKSMVEIPVIQQARTKGVSKFKMLKWLPRYLRWYWFAVRNSF